VSRRFAGAGVIILRQKSIFDGGADGSSRQVLSSRVISQKGILSRDSSSTSTVSLSTVSDSELSSRTYREFKYSRM
jgi:hypothetical protein